ncbi:acyl-CoA dehydrogenase [Ekhidna sp.]|uniref:acyl-CoA dehydrogenase family protein n=1 Tax=Ekhidna sp. TaxID=2608089 RepID=UPI003B5CF727
MRHMLQSPVLQANPALYSFLPMFYMAWADAVLTPGEVTSLQSIIEKQHTLKADERAFLLSFLDPKDPPTPNELKSWLKTIRESSDRISEKEKKSVVEIGIDLARLHQAPDAEELKVPLLEIEEALGIISEESAYHLRSLQRTTTSELLSTAPGFDIDAMGDLLDGEHKEIIQRVKTVLTDPAFNYVDPDNLTAYRAKVLEWCKLHAAQGFGSTAYPQEFGGEDDMAKYFAIMETLSYHDLSVVVKFGVQFGLWGMSIYFLGTEKHHKKYLTDIGTLKLPGCFAMTETGHGSNVKGIETTATYNHKKNNIIIHTPNHQAGKEYIGNAALHGRMATVFAKLIVDDVDYGVNAFVVPLRDEKGKTMPGITIEDCGRKMGLNGVDNGKIWFDQVQIPLENMLDRYASIDENGEFQSPITSDNRRFFTMLGTLVGGRIGIPRSGISAAKSGLTIAIRYGDSRRQFGAQNGSEVPILNYRTHQRRLMPLLATTYGCHFALQHLTKRFMKRTEDDMQEIEAMAAGLKAFSTWHTTQTLQECREACGGKGYLSENRIDQLKNDTDVYTTFEGDNTVLMQLVAKSRLSDFKKEFSDINLFGMLGYVAEQAKTNLAEMNPIIVRSTDVNHLLDFEFHRKAFAYRERDILTSAAKRLRKHLSLGMDSFDAFNQAQYHMVGVGFAYVEQLILEQFIAQVEATENPLCKAALTKLCQLFALSQIEKNKGWYLEHGYMEGVKTKAIRKLINQLCWDVRQDAVPLVDAFRIPDVVLGAPIAMSK